MGFINAPIFTGGVTAEPWRVPPASFANYEFDPENIQCLAESHLPTDGDLQHIHSLWIQILSEKVTPQFSSQVILPEKVRLDP